MRAARPFSTNLKLQQYGFSLKKLKSNMELIKQNVKVRNA
jgi:seryl-tRNA synthetase